MRTIRNLLVLLGLLFLEGFPLTLTTEARSIWDREVASKDQQSIVSDNPWSIQVSSRLGFIIEYSAPKRFPLIMHIQDAHANPPAQLMMSGILRELIEQHQIHLVCVEGADGGFDDSLFDIERPRLKEKVVRYLLNEARLTGAEYEWLLHSSPGATYSTPFTLWGIEDQEIYTEHWNVWEKSQKSQQEVVDLAEQILRKVHANYGKYASSELLQYEQTAEAFRQGVSGFKTYLEELSQVLQGHPVDMSHYPETQRLLKVLKGELTGPLMIGLTSTGELDRLEQDIRISLAKSHSEKEYVQWSRLAGLFVRFVKLEMTPAEWKEYTLQRQTWESFVKDQLQTALPDIIPFQQFYELAEKRDNILFKNAFSKMEELQLDRLILITGGFHSHGITDQLRAQEIPYLVIAPRVEAPTNPAIYTKAMYAQPLTEEEVQEIAAKVQ